MLAKSAINLTLFLALSSSVFSLPTSNAPTRTRCLCTIVSTENQFLTPSPLSSSPASSQSDLCADLSSELEYIRGAEPDLYRAYLHLEDNLDATPSSTTDDDLVPLSTNVLMEIAARSGLEEIDVMVPRAPSYGSAEQIVCRPESEAGSDHHYAASNSQSNFYALQVIISLAVLACIAECASLFMDRYNARRNCQNTFVQLSGSEKRLRAYAAPDRLSWIAVDKTSGCIVKIVDDRDFDDEDDEMNLPIM